MNVKYKIFSSKLEQTSMEDLIDFKLPVQNIANVRNSGICE